ncbi:DUF945 family protein [Celerinatantimonas diazotrophica]|uniref:Uncharacterized protein DUF945 n=1 Tax=Celerinatantimonas diazotrophica TaxID=412034 RepID=A0A4R1JLQ2_9GAMM|nr:DUF945 family protein [Celerinatantimonas diazotrophica]TCK51995.1 uncharacterized protein DUF945 [Celerinatantimonas diazotrophica]CAG9296302.1 hypothetical protein CEDIAZO_01450 [Celerinatantimonas diazotrophica]
MSRRIILLLAIFILLIAGIPLLNGWAAYKITNTLMQNSGLKIKTHQYDWGYLSGQETFTVATQNKPTTITVNSHYFGLGPTATVLFNGKPTFTSHWSWHPSKLSISGEHHYIGETQLFRHLQLTTILSNTQLINTAKLSSFHENTATSSILVKGFELISKTRYSHLKSSHRAHAKWQFKLHIDQFNLQNTYYQWRLNTLNWQTDITPQQPLSDYQTDFTLHQLHYRGKALATNLDYMKAHISMQASREAIHLLSSAPSGQWHNWQQQLTPLIANGLHIQIHPLQINDGKQQLNLHSSLSIAPTSFSDSSLDTMLLLQNITMELHANADSQLLDKLLPDPMLAWIEHGIQSGLIIQQGQTLKTNLLYQRGELKADTTPPDEDV